MPEPVVAATTRNRPATSSRAQCPRVASSPLRPPWLSERVRSQISQWHTSRWEACNLYLDPDHAQALAAMGLQDDGPNRFESFLDARRGAMWDQMQSYSTLPSSPRPPPPLSQAQGDTALCPCPPPCWGTCKRCRKERCDRPADHEESCWCRCDRPTPPPTPPSDSRLPLSSPHVQRERPHDRLMKKWRALDQWASLVSKYWRALWAS